jgi:transposase InsO family protein
MVTGLPAIEEKQGYDTCIITKQRRAPFPAKVNYGADAPLNLVHGDLCGPITPATSAGRRFFLLLVDDATRYMWLTLLSAKGDAASVIKVIKAVAELEVGQPLRVLRTDNDGEFTAKEFATYCSDEGVQRHVSTPYTPQQNEVVERRNQTVLGTTCALLKERGMPTRFWGEPMTTIVILLNRAPMKALSGKKSFEAYHGCKPAVDFLKTFGCVGFIKNKRPGLKKLDDRSAPMVFIGYSEGAKAYRMLEPGTGRVHVYRDVIFDKNRGWEWDSTASDGDSAAQREFIVQYYTAQPPADNVDGGVPEEGALPPSPGQAAPLLDPGTPPPVEL